MKKVVFPFIGAAIIIGAIVFNISIGLRSDSLSDLTLANIEALAQSEDGAVIECTQSNCSGGQCHQSSYDPSCPCVANGYPGWTCNNWSNI